MDSITAAHAREPRNIHNVLELVGVGLLDCRRRLAGLSGKGAEQRGSENRQLVYACVDDTSANRLVNHKRAANCRPRKSAVARAGVNPWKVRLFQSVEGRLLAVFELIGGVFELRQLFCRVRDTEFERWPGHSEYGDCIRSRT